MGRTYFCRLKPEMNFLESAISGCIAGGIAALFTNPIDVIKTNLMINIDKKFNTYLDCMKFLYQEDGFKAFYRGAIYRTIHVSIMSVVVFSAYENLLNYTIKKIGR